MTPEGSGPSGPIASGRTADVYAVGDEKVVKLLKAGWPTELLHWEALKTDAVHAAGIPSPAVFEEIEVAGRRGVLFERIDGLSMLDTAFTQPDRAVELAEQLATLHAATLTTSIPELPDIKDGLAASIAATDLPTRQRVAATDSLLGLPDGTATLHSDFHPGNVMLADQGAVIIDWANAARGDPAADIARSLLMMTPAGASEVADITSELERVIVAFADAYRQRVLQLVDVQAADVEAWRLPVVAARIAEGIAEEHDLLHAEVARLTS